MMNPAGLSYVEADNEAQVTLVNLVPGNYFTRTSSWHFRILPKNVFKGEPGNLHLEIRIERNPPLALETHAVPDETMKQGILFLVKGVLPRDITLTHKMAEEESSSIQ